MENGNASRSVMKLRLREERAVEEFERKLQAQRAEDAREQVLWQRDAIGHVVRVVQKVSTGKRRVEVDGGILTPDEAEELAHALGHAAFNARPPSRRRRQRQEA